MKYDFIEIGTSDFETLIENASEETVGLSIEPLKDYLDELPDKPNVKKLNIAVAVEEGVESVDLYYVPRKIILERNIKPWIKGCNRIGGIHPAHINWGIQHLVEVATIPCYQLSTILEEHEVTELDFLKIDIEGFDYKILDLLVPYLKSKEKSFWPKKIQFENNYLTPKPEVKKTIEAYVGLGYRAKVFEVDTVFTLEET
jgi:FkbM family methyltransferase